MVQILIMHKCNGEAWMDAWKEDGPGSNKAVFKEGGMKILKLFRGAFDSDLTGLLVEAESMEAFIEFSKSTADNPNHAAQAVDPRTLQSLVALPESMLE